MSNVLLVIASQGFRDEELLETKKALEAAGNKVKIASTDTRQAKGMLGATVKPDMSLEAANIDEFDAIAFIGGNGAVECRPCGLVRGLFLAHLLPQFIGQVRGERRQQQYHVLRYLGEDGLVHRQRGRLVLGLVIVVDGVGKLHQRRNRATTAKVRYFDLRWDNQVAAGDLQDNQVPKVRPEEP